MRATSPYWSTLQVSSSGDAGLAGCIERQTICLADVEAAIQEWTRNAAARDIDGTTALYDPSGGRLVGTVDEASSIRRNTPEAIREYSAAFCLGRKLGHVLLMKQIEDFCVKYFLY